MFFFPYKYFPPQTKIKSYHLITPLIYLVLYKLTKEVLFFYKSYIIHDKFNFV